MNDSLVRAIARKKSIWGPLLSFALQQNILWSGVECDIRIDSDTKKYLNIFERKNYTNIVVGQPLRIYLREKSLQILYWVNPYKNKYCIGSTLTITLNMKYPLFYSASKDVHDQNQPLSRLTLFSSPSIETCAKDKWGTKYPWWLDHHHPWHHGHRHNCHRGKHPQKNLSFLGLSPKLWVGGGEES